jgi:hypothetical protein
MTLADRILIAAVAGLILASHAFVGTYAMQGSIVTIQVHGKTLHKATLRETRSISVQGSHGLVTVEIRDGKVAVVKAECPNHVCVRIGWRSHAGEVIVCVPNVTVVRIGADQRDGVRAITG